MSSATSPAITLELRTDWLVLGALSAWSGLLLTCLWQAEIPALLRVAASAVVVLGSGVALDSQLFRISPRAPVRASWAADGQWCLQFGDGSEISLAFSRASRPIPRGVLVVLRATGRFHWLLLRNGPTDGGDLRRLRVRMSLQR